MSHIETMFGGGISHEEGNSVEPNALFTGNSSRDTNNVVEEKPPPPLVVDLFDSHE
jgi:hypothetical protein